MKTIADVVNAISGVINGLTLPAREKKELQAEILRLVYEREREMIEARASVIRAEAAGNWLQRSWRPVGDVDICCYCTYWHFHEFAHVGGYFPVHGICWRLGWAGTWWGGAGKKWRGHFSDKN